MSSFSSKIKIIDFYRKIPKDLTEPTFHGALLSTCAMIFMTLLFIFELWAYMSTTTITEVSVDQNDDPSLRINFNITLMDVSCDYASIDVWDILGTNKLNVTKNIEKWRLDEKGVKRIYQGRNRELQSVGHDTHHPSIEELHANGVHARSYSWGNNGDEWRNAMESNEYTFVNFYAPWCIWCQRLEPIWEAFAEQAEREGLPVRIAKVDCVANSQLCMDQKIGAFPSLKFFKRTEYIAPAYKGERKVQDFMNFARQRIENDISAGQKKELNNARKLRDEQINAEHPGCMLSGYLLVNRVPGNFHIEARSKSHNINAAMTNLSHIVHHLSFGQPMKERLLTRLKSVPEAFEHSHPLDGEAFVTENFHEAHRHYLQIVTTNYEIERRYRSQDYLQTYKMLSSSQIMNYAKDDVPEARFAYELSPMSITVRREGKHFYEFITSLCAIIGGTFTVVGLLNGLLHTVFKPKKL